MIKLLKNKRAMANGLAGTMPWPKKDPFSMAKQGFHEFRRAAVGQAKEYHRTIRAAVRKRVNPEAAGRGLVQAPVKAAGAVARGVEKVAGVGAKGTENIVRTFFFDSGVTINKLFIKPLGRVMSWLSSRLVAALFVFSIMMFIWLATPRMAVFAAAENLETPGDWVTIAVKKSGMDKFPDILKNFQKRWTYQTYGQFSNPDYGEDQTRYGIYLTSSNIAPLKSKYYPGEEIVVFAHPEAVILSAERSKIDKVKVFCSLDDSELVEVFPGEEIFLHYIPDAIISCTFMPVKVTDDPLKEATMTLRYPFIVTATLPVSVMDPDEYEKMYTAYAREYDHNPVRIKDALAKSVGVNAEQLAETKITPVTVGAEITEPQPIVKDDHTTTLLVTVYNEGQGIIDKINSVEIDMGQLGLALKPIGVPLDGNSIEEGYLDTIPPIKKDDFVSFIFGVTSGDFDMKGDKVTTTRINIEVRYFYNVTAKTGVKVATCRGFPAECVDPTETPKGTDPGLPPKTPTEPTGETSPKGPDPQTDPSKQ